MRTIAIFLKNLILYIGKSFCNFWSLLKIVIILIIVFAACYFYIQNRNAQALLNNSQLASNSEEETGKLVKEIGLLMILPEGETPTLVSVVDKEKVKDQPFFAKAENGDKVLVYTAAKKAILYRPANKKIIEIGPVDLAAQSNLKIALYNSTADQAVLAKAEKKLVEQVTNLDFPVKETTNYDTSDTLVVDLAGDKKTEAEQLAKLLDGKVATLPAGFKKPATDFLIILAE